MCHPCKLFLIPSLFHQFPSPVFNSRQRQHQVPSLPNCQVECHRTDPAHMRTAPHRLRWTASHQPAFPARHPVLRQAPSLVRRHRVTSHPIGRAHMRPDPHRLRRTASRQPAFPAGHPAGILAVCRVATQPINQARQPRNRASCPASIPRTSRVVVRHFCRVLYRVPSRAKHRPICRRHNPSHLIPAPHRAYHLASSRVRRQVKTS